MRELICFGEITHDTIGTADAPALPGSASILNALATFYGGRGANVATFFARWRTGAALVSAAGEDFVRAGQRDLLERRGVDCSGVLIEADRPTPRAFMFHTGSVSETFFFRAAAPACDAALAEHVRRIAERDCARCVYCTSGHQDLNLHLLTRLPSELKVYAPGPQIFHYPLAELQPFLAAANALFLNRAEADYLRQTTGLGSADLNRDYRLAFHVVTHGSGGCTVYEGHGQASLPACRPDVEVDPTGAGDAFAGAFLAEYLASGDARAAAQLALVASSFVVERLGCQENVPAPEAARERLREYVAGRRSLPATAPSTSAGPLRVDDFYDRVAAEYSDGERHPTTHAFKRAEEAVTAELLAGRRFRAALDIGCGDGNFLDGVMADEKVGVDCAVEMLRRHRRRLPTASFLLADCQRPLPLAPAAFDVVHCSFVLDHLTDVDACLREIGRLVADDGIVLLAVYSPGPFLAGEVEDVLRYRTAAGHILSVRRSFRDLADLGRRLAAVLRIEEQRTVRIGIGDLSLDSYLLKPLLKARG